MVSWQDSPSFPRLCRKTVQGVSQTCVKEAPRIKPNQIKFEQVIAPLGNVQVDGMKSLHPFKTRKFDQFYKKTAK